MGEIQHILTERDILTRAESLWLVKLLYAFQDADYVYLAMEYVPGGDMRTLLNNYGVLREEHARFYIAEMLMGVAELHRLGYIHRDLKPENFLIDASGHVKLTDFGLSRGILSQECIDALKTKLERIKSAPFVPKTVEEKINIYKSVRRDAIMAYSLVGSPDYMAPEVLTNNGQGYGIAVDYWSLGCILFELLAGYPPFTASKSDDVWSNVYHWKKVLERPVYSGEDEEFNFSDVAWNLITRLISDVSTRICKVSDLQNHPFFTSLLFSNLRTSLAPLPPFVPQLSSELDVSYFDDFSNTKDMAIYKEVWERQERLQNEVMSKKDDNSVPRTIFVGFTFKHKGKKQIVTDCDDLDQQSMTIKYENTNMCYMFYNT
ncbi:hypothetical protein HK098_002888 [Nowakowskiella sp. JEL0407]|nr:hypothetical protein HK098_002888 [Nowakowskiella sp. JEL0407]